MPVTAVSSGMARSAWNRAFFPRLPAGSQSIPSSGVPSRLGRSHRSSRVSAYGLLHPDLAHSISPADLTAALSVLRDLPASLLHWYDDQALRFPLQTKAATSGVCYGLGDLCAQGLEGEDLFTMDLGRAARSGTAGFIGHGPLRHYWLDFLDKSLTFGGAWWSLGPKVALDQGAMTMVENSIYGLLMGALALERPAEILRNVRRALVPQMAASVRFWPAVDLVTFTVIPVELQVLWEDVAEIVWICILQDVAKKVTGTPVMLHSDPIPITVPVTEQGMLEPAVRAAASRLAGNTDDVPDKSQAMIGGPYPYRARWSRNKRPR